jgi:hypothetical protein
MSIKKFLPYLAMSLLAVPALAAAAGPVRGGWSLSNITSILGDAANWLYVIGFAVALIIVVIGGISYMTAGGDEEKTGKAKKTIITGLIGAAIILLAGIILDTLAKFLGVTPPA